ncbi:ABC transporter substrate-binding protein [Streptosporangium sp. NPDC049644]|uniref:ABC transporter substrate-binding protein n=1 Tax=Streptosporangium sp. NPDC049644 TaxID=3155507 RepID=UPI003420291F
MPPMRAPLTLLRSAVALSLLLAIAACGSGNEPAAVPATSGGSAAPEAKLETQKVIFSGVTANAGNWAIQVGVEFGVFRQYGLDVSMIYSQSSPNALAAMIGGSVQFTSTVYDAVVLAHQKDPRVIAVAEGYRSYPEYLVVPPEVTSFADLKGATCGAQNPEGIGDALYLSKMMEHGGKLRLGQDYRLTNVNLNAGPALAALKSGQIKCIAVLPPTSTLLEKQGYRILYDLQQVPEYKDLSFFGIIAMQAWLSENPNTARAFLKGYLASIAYLYDPANKEKVLDLLARNAQVERSVAEASYTWVTAGAYPRDGVIAATVVPRTVALMKSGGSLDASAPDDVAGLVDNSHVKAAYQELPDSVKSGPGPEGLLPEGQRPA